MNDNSCLAFRNAPRILLVGLLLTIELAYNQFENKGIIFEH